LNSGGPTRLTGFDLAGLQLLERFKVPVPRFFEILQGLLQRLRGRVLQLERLRFFFPSRHLLREIGIARTKAAQVKDLLLERESTVEDEAARAGKPAHLMRQFFIYSKFKCVPLEASYFRNDFAYSSPQLV
jgi:hypothetical protein